MRLLTESIRQTLVELTDTEIENRLTMQSLKEMQD